MEGTLGVWVAKVLFNNLIQFTDAYGYLFFIVIKVDVYTQLIIYVFCGKWLAH